MTVTPIITPIITPVITMKLRLFSAVAIGAGMALINGGCQMTDALAATNSMPDRMDQTNAQIAATNAKMDSTNSAIHKQVLGTALSEMLKPENSEYLLPPTGMLPFAQEFADEATPLEIVKLAYVFFKDINEVEPSNPPTDASGNVLPDFMASFDHKKLVKFYAIQLIAGLMTQDRAEEIARSQIEAPGRYEDAALGVLMLRESCLQDILVVSDLFAGKLDNVGKLEEAAKRIGDAEWVAKRPYADRIVFKTTGMLDPGDNISLKITPKSIAALWTHLQKSLDTELSPEKVKATPRGAERVQEIRVLLRAHPPA